MNWLRISQFSAVMGVLALTILLGQVPSHDEPPIAAADPGHDTSVLDYSDAEIRKALLRHERFLSAWNFDSLNCSQGRTTIRVVHEGGLGGGKWIIAELNANARDASLDVFEFATSPSREGKSELDWTQIASMRFRPKAVDGIQEQLNSILGADISPQLNYQHVDAPRVTVETCRRHRYHFFVFSPDESDEDVKKVSMFAQSILQLAGKDRAAVWAPSL